MEPSTPYHLSKIQFGLYNAEELRNLSSKEITNSNAFNAEGKPMEGGLYDQAMGPSAMDNKTDCVTCGNKSATCLGHIGHIELATPVFNPFYVSEILKLMRHKCDFCHRLRLSERHRQEFMEKLQRIRAGEMFMPPKNKINSTIIGLDWLQGELKAEEEEADKIGGKGGLLNSAQLKARIETIRELWQNITRLCYFCPEKKQSTIANEEDLRLIRTPFVKQKAKEKGQKPKQQVLLPAQVQSELLQLWQNDKKILKFIYNIKDFSNFFIEVLGVQPNRFRPENKMRGERVYLHTHTSNLSKIYNLNTKLKALAQEENSQEITATCQNLQAAVNTYFDSKMNNRNAQTDNSGIRQLLEKKEGLFRMKMMGKRVNYTARSVISPDPYIETGEIGIPVVFAKKLTMPVGVTEFNANHIAELVKNGPNVYPGANLIVDLDGTQTLLDYKTPAQLRGLSLSLLTNGAGKIVYRHVLNGDWMLVNRQPTLHKPSIMAHKVKVLPKQNTIRMHYANCSTYNADFDGDEINLHLPQTYLPVSEAKNIVSTSQQYTVPTSGKPLRGLIQDHIVSGVLMTYKDAFFTKSNFVQILYSAGVPTFKLVKPAIIWPRELWTGKQIISTLLTYLAEDRPGINLRINCKVAKCGWHSEEDEFVVSNNYLCTGVLDKNQIGSTEFGLVHSVHELYGTDTCSRLLSIIGRLCTIHLQQHGFTCGIEDLILSEDTDIKRREEINTLYFKGIMHLSQKVGAGSPQLSRFETRRLVKPGEQLSIKNPFRRQKDKHLRKSIQSLILNNENMAAEIDREMISSLNASSSRITKLCFPNGIAKKFPYNNFAMMVTSGGKGSIVNHKQISCMLGQQELEGRRVPTTILGRSLPSFLPYDPHPRAGGFVADRFLTGLRPQEYYFHCMAGREGLVDTAVKTSKSGYLQRCLIKGLEGVMAAYDYTVRESDGSIIQFCYGEDGIDPSKIKYLNQFGFMTRNIRAYMKKLKYRELSKKLDFSYYDELVALAESDVLNTPLEKMSPGVIPGSMSPKFIENLHGYILDARATKQRVPSRLKKLVALKYMQSLIHPGEMVGIIAAQSIGEPSTQLTLNTFHLAGHGGANVTLGIPRLREILMTMSNKMETPAMTLPFYGNNEEALKFANSMKKLSLSEVIKQIKVVERRVAQENFREFTLKLYTEDIIDIEKSLDIRWRTIVKTIKMKLLPQLMQNIKRAVSTQQVRNTFQATKLKQVSESEEGPSKKSKEDSKAKGGKKKSKKMKGTEEDIYSFQDDESKQKIKLKFNIPNSQKSLLILSLVQESLKEVNISSVSGITKCHVLTRKGKIGQEVVVQTEGVNIRAAWQHPNKIDINRIETNSLRSMLDHYGIEACAATIIKELNAIFSHYGIQVDRRHLSLIADHMTFNGTLRPFNRGSMPENYSPILRMSFEKTVSYIVDSCLNGDVDPGISASSCLVMGKPSKCGTGYFDIYEDFVEANEQVRIY